MPLLNPGDVFPGPRRGAARRRDPAAARRAGRPLRPRAALSRLVVSVLQRAAAGVPASGGPARRGRRPRRLLSVDDEPTTSALIDRYRLRFPVGHSADADAIHDAIGAFINEQPKHLQSTGFVLDPDGRVIVSVYSSGAIGRLVPDDVVGLVRYVREHANLADAEEEIAR
jgi:hypothetical protein